MALVLDKIIIFFICLFHLTLLPSNITMVVCVLVTISTSSLCYYLQTKRVAFYLLLFYFLLCLWQPLFTIFLPLFVYDIALYKLKYLGLLYILPLLQSTQIHNIKVSGIIVIVSIIAFIMEYRTEKHDKLLHDYMRLRDTSAELNFYLSKKNRMLMENQDYEIHVATLKERNRIAREIHDNVGHMISRSILQVGALMTICKDEVSSTNLLSLKDTLNEAMNSIRESVHGLHEDSIDLYASINGITQKFQDYQITVDYDMSESVSRNIKYCFISVIKEAISNVVKHSNADKIDIIVREHPMFYQLLIKDNGTCRMENRTPEGIGLENMNARVLNLNGNISIDSKDGFKIFISIPKGSDEEEQNENSNRRR